MLKGKGVKSYKSEIGLLGKYIGVVIRVGCCVYIGFLNRKRDYRF